MALRRVTSLEIIKDEKSDLLAVSHSILSRLRNYFSQLLNIRGFYDVTETEIHTTEPLMREPSAFEVELATERLKSHK